MTHVNLTLLLGMTIAATLACGPRVDPEAALEKSLAERQARLEQALADPDNLQPDAPIARWILPDELAELSGLTLTSNGRLLTHVDEFAKVFEIDYRRGVIVKEFSLGPPLVNGDFEAIAAVGDTLILLTSKGVLYRFLEGENEAGVPFSTLDTGLGKDCEFEGMAFDSSANELILACKNVEDGGRNNIMLLYRWPMARDSATTTPPPVEIVVPLTAMVGRLGWSKIEPSDIAINPRNGNYVIIAAGQLGLVEITPLGEVVISRTLPRGHEQPEGLAITRENLMLISDEASTGPAVLTVYRMPK